MLELLVLVVAFILLLLIIVWAHYLNQNRQNVKIDNSFRDETNVRLYHEHKAEIEKDFQQGSLDKESYEYLVAELEQSLLQDIQDNANEANQSIDKKSSLSIVWPATISLFIIIFSVALYSERGSMELIANTPKENGSHQTLDEQQQLIVEIQKLKKATEQQPNNSDAWYSLGQALVGIGEFDEALTAFDKVIGIDGEQADLFGAKAQASYYKNAQKITEEVQYYIDKALSLDAKDPSTNILLGMNNFINKNYQQAIDYWQTVVNDNRPSVNSDALKSAIVEAKNRLALTGGMVADNASLAGPQLSLHVSISEEILTQLNAGEDKVVFIYAIPSEGGRMPLAAIKVQASDLPLDVVLNDQRAMTPAAKLSDAEQVNVYAIISNNGGVGIKPGDYKAEKTGVRVDTTDVIELVIDRLVE
ncbi:MULTISPECIES: c-type cytochrome biogenesis protein CcmI [Thalassotalea]|uniref:C-type cytochrome biogenesis protein CcmI n=1 Tax=Thalassotalea castellviae TaxID=3075612 RepID=A0ABU2ZYX3_9GAMM|nr:c-type cytochrome biogenesis protein CcmI [Thalassotalea sp. W431]MDT0603112.1 c-type cytochrome biogenesis protein CcmI [Thalassotalea sp. W431]